MPATTRAWPSQYQEARISFWVSHVDVRDLSIRVLTASHDALVDSWTWVAGIWTCACSTLWMAMAIPRGWLNPLWSIQSCYCNDCLCNSMLELFSHLGLCFHTPSQTCDLHCSTLHSLGSTFSDYIYEWCHEIFLCLAWLISLNLVISSFIHLLGIGNVYSSLFH